jgi:hypothetical protein
LPNAFARSAAPRCVRSVSSPGCSAFWIMARITSPRRYVAELRDDNLQMTRRMRATHTLCDKHGDVASASLLENWIDEAEGRTWFLYEAKRRDPEVTTFRLDTPDHIESGKRHDNILQTYRGNPRGCSERAGV